MKNISILLILNGIFQTTDMKIKWSTSSTVLCTPKLQNNTKLDAFFLYLSEDLLPDVFYGNNKS